MTQFEEKKCYTVLQEMTNQQAGAPVVNGDIRAQVNGDAV